MAVAFLGACTGCQGPNHYFAETTMPDGLRLTSRSNPQEINLGKIASVAGSSQMINPGDMLDVTIAASLSKDDLVTHPVLVGDDGTGELPQIGNVKLMGATPQVAAALIRREVVNQGYYLNPTVNVSVVEKKMNRVRVLGAVKEPGEYLLSPNSSDIVSAIAAGGGLAEDAGEMVEVRNPIGAYDASMVSDNPDSSISAVSNRTESGGMRSFEVNLVSAARAGTGSYLVHDDGVVFVEKRDPPPLTVIGLVKEPGPVEFPPGKDIRLLEAIGLAGGIRNQLADKVFVLRQVAGGGDPAVVQVSLREAKRSGRSNMLLGPGDVVSVEQTIPTVMLEALQIIRIGLAGNVGLF